ncbi:flagellar filament capping protein FliD [Pantoea anthophila]|uniref:flagellar filament capping protein FliD n=1 Tax=Pantoea anthophila TaxID=470931 RepID=UPI002785D0EC|nr:flagellar filament capping protein FliD [Pantoea anthophila]MDQ1213499.1 flagellar hook-associated protein 2 [Pantoea anthophila]
MAISANATINPNSWDYSGLLDGMQKFEQMRLTPYTNMQTSYTSKVSQWGSISSLMTNLQKSVKTLSGQAFNTMKVSTNTAFSATATSDASADTHAVTVDQLATAHKMKTRGFESADAQLGGATSDGTRTLTLTQGDGKEMKVTLSDDETSLNKIASAINKQSADQGGSISASVQRDSSGQYQLMLSSKKTGSDGEMSINVEGDESLGNILNTSKGGKGSAEAGSDADQMIQVSAAQDARLSVDGIDYTRASNNISDIITGVTLTLNAKSVADSGPEQLTLTTDTSAIKTSLQDFVKQYNALLTETTAASRYVTPSKGGSSSSTGDKSGALMGDSTLRGLVNELRTALNNSYQGDKGSSSSLAQLGIKIDSQSGQMSLDENKLDKAIADNPENISKMFQGSGQSVGLATSLSTVLTKYLGDSDTKTKGIISSATDDLNKQLKTVGEQITKTQALIDSRLALLQSQYAKAAALSDQMTNMSTTLANMFSKM